MKKQRHHFADKGLSSQSCGVSSGHVGMWELDHKENWAPKNLICGVGEDPWESLGLQADPTNQSYRKSVLIFIGRTDAEAEAPILWPPDAKSWLIGKDPDSGKDWRQEETEVTEDEMVGWHHRLNGHEFQQTQGDSDGQWSPACCSPWGCRVRHDWVTQQEQVKIPSASEYQVLPVTSECLA